MTDSTNPNPEKKPNLKLWILIAASLLVLLILIIVVLWFVLVKVRGGGSLFPARATDTEISTSTWVAFNYPTDTPTLAPTATITPSPTITPTPTLGIGSTRVRELDGMVMVYVPGGEFQMGSDSDVAFDNEKPVHPVRLLSFWIDKTEVTNAMFRKFVDAAGYVTDAQQFGESYAYQSGPYIQAGNKWKKVKGADWMHPLGPVSSIDGLDNYPVVQVSWNDAEAYCNWVAPDAVLPTEAEWEFAARGTDGRIYPWGNQPPTEKLANSADTNLDAIWTDKYINDGYKFTAPVGSFPDGASPFGLLDMSGNVAEWVADIFSDRTYRESPVDEPKGAEAGFIRIARGGQWSYTADGLRATARVQHSLNHSIDYTGFRCALMPGAK
jgi:formylglycine-generating enzyme required for sulfatase activity